MISIKCCIVDYHFANWRGSLTCSDSLISVIFGFILVSDLKRPQDGPAYHLPQEVVLQYQEQQEEGGEDPWWQAGFPGTFRFCLPNFFEMTWPETSLFSVFEEAAICAQVPDDGPEAEGCHPGHQPGEGPHVQEAEDRLQVLNCSLFSSSNFLFSKPYNL